MREPWRTILAKTLEDLDGADPLYAPTSFWQPGVKALLGDLERSGLERFKSWPAAQLLLLPALRRRLHLRDARSAHPADPAGQPERNASLATRPPRGRDARTTTTSTSSSPCSTPTAADRRHGPRRERRREASTALPAVRPERALLRQALPQLPQDPRRRVPPPRPRGSFGARDRRRVRRARARSCSPTIRPIQYVNVDIPPLSVVAHYYLSECFPDQTVRSHLDLKRHGGFKLGTGSRDRHPSRRGSCRSSEARPTCVSTRSRSRRWSRTWSRTTPTRSPGWDRGRWSR